MSSAFLARTGRPRGPRLGLHARPNGRLCREPSGLRRRCQGAASFRSSAAYGASYRGYHTNELARIVSGKAGYEAEYLYLPAFFDSEAELNFAQKLEAYSAVQADWSTMELALINISNFPSYPDLGVEYRYGSRLTEERAVGPRPRPLLRRGGPRH